MARAGRKDRGLLSKLDSTSKPVWFIQLYHEGQERRFGSLLNKTKTWDFFEKAKLEQKTDSFQSGISMAGMNWLRDAHLNPTHLKAAVESVAKFGKPAGGKTPAPVQGTKPEPILNATVTESGMAGPMKEESKI